MQLFLRSGFFGLLLCASACVPTKQLDAERQARITCNAQLSILSQELALQREERAHLTAQVGELNRQLGELDKTVTDQQSTLGASSDKMGVDIARLQADLGARNARLASMNTAFVAITDIQALREQALTQVFDELKKRYSGKTGSQIDIQKDKNTVVLTFSDKSLFGANIMHVTPEGINNLKPLAALFAERPELDAEIRAYTDNLLPKNKEITDAWDWSTQRALNIVRVCTKELNVNGNQVTPIGGGEYHPVAGNATPEGRAQNRRTEIVVLIPMPELPVFIDKP
jgi:chemotaxis protein MotB